MHWPFAKAFLAIVLLAAAASANASELEGRTFEGEIVDENGVPRAKDTVTFKDGKFHSVTCGRFGFSEVLYWMRTDGDAIHFLVQSVHPENGSMNIKGTVRGEQAEWMGVWTKKRWYWSIRREIAFRGMQKK
jgi:hypothetical protein